MKRLNLILVLILCLAVSGCTKIPANDVDQAYALPTPQAEETLEILGETIEYAPVSVTFHYVSGDGTSFSTIKRFMTPSATENFCASVLQTLMFSTSFSSQMTFIPSGTQIGDIEYADGIATVQLSVEALNVQDETDTLMMIACLTNTLLSIPDVTGMNILIAGRAVSICELPVGVKTEAYSGIAATYAQMNTENSYFLVQFTGTIERDAVLYFPSKNGDWLISEIHQIDFNSTDYASALIRALRSGSETIDSAIPPLPEDLDLLISNPTTEISKTGERVLTLDLSSKLRNYLAMTDLEEWKAIASIVLTVTSFVPDIDAIRITLDGVPLSGCQIGEKYIAFPDNLIHRNDFTDRIGGAFTAYLPNEDGTLLTTEGVLSMAQSQSPQCVLGELLALSEATGHSAFPDGVSESDILGVSVDDSVCTVNLSANFYRQALKSSKTEERAWVYAVVNTLCSFENIQGVRFLIEGRMTESITGAVYLSTVLLPTDPAITQTEES